MQLIDCEKGQVINIDDSLRVTVLEIHDGEITVSIESPEDPTLNRIETLRLLREEAPQLELASAGA
ncbi:MAG: carbon storage regulator [Planctomycetaceae bacterium]